MSIKVAVSGFGRIGRNVTRALFESTKHSELELVAINDLADPKTNAHLIKYDSTFGTFSKEVMTDGDDLVIDGKLIKTFGEREPKKLPWEKLGVDVVLECSGAFTTKDKAIAHINAGAKKVLISAPAKGVDATIVYGVNHHSLKKNHHVVSNASCTTNCLAPVAKVLNDSVGIEKGLMTTVHAYTNDQKLVDSYHSDLRRARSATQSMIPTKTGAAAAVGLVLPELNGKLDGFAIRVPTINVSVVDLTFLAHRDTTVDEINAIIKLASDEKFKSIIAYNEEPLVSCDFNKNPASSVFDSTQTRVQDNLVKIISWYDNEWGFSNRMLDTCAAMASSGY